ncbi:two-component sensor histidine kinase [Neobacillus notoginsengisoli]|uniref:histidine kinase n=1 Tax=Neobacillus notoginsengisoli TaxID=1578198 RepID=A0A417YVS8_9BACI|nr:ATP-binding protein [Neobacillus notoginsengisoli]RHW41500.1 two-component sensor histidine kinase [Neobacillus notoginsengisoli]
MNGVLQNKKMEQEELKALKFCIWLFYISFIGVDLLFYVFFPNLLGIYGSGAPFRGIGFWYYIIGLTLLPISIFMYKRKKIYFIKYFYFIGFNVLDLINNILIYKDKNIIFQSGNFSEVVFFLFTPIFISKRYFWTVTIGILIKYLVTGIVLHTNETIAPMTLLTVISAITYILLIRFKSYLNSLSVVYEEMNQKEKLIGIGQMATGIAHEIRNPLTSLKGFVQLQQELKHEEKDFFPIMKQEIDRINSIVDDLMILGKPSVVSSFDKVNIKDIVDYGLSIAEQFARGTEIKFIKEYDNRNPEYIRGDEKQLKQVVINLVKNSIESMPDKGTVKVSIKIEGQDKVVLSIADEGNGISEDNLQKLFEPFFTTKKDGTGLGLMVSNQIIKEHKGLIQVDSKLGKGTKVDIIFPKI